MAIEQNANYSPSERIVSPGVFTREIDQSFLAQGVAAIGGVVVAPFNKGPGFSPTVITSEGDLTSIFGDPDGTLYGPIAAQQYLRQQGQVTVCRVGGLGGYEQKDALIISAIPGQYARFAESGSFSGSLLDSSVTYVSAGVFVISGSLSLEFSSGIYTGSTVVVGDVAFTTVAGQTATGSNSGSFVSCVAYNLSVISSNLPAASTIPTASITLSPAGGCNYTLDISGILTGSYGAINVSNWTPDTISSEDSCGSASMVTGRDEVVLAVLANTAYDRGQNLFGFSGSVLLETASNATVLDAEYSLVLNDVHFDTDTNQYVSSSYGTYTFSLDTESSAYLTNVFGTDPKAGFVPVAAGQKIEAAYTYKNFKNRTKEVINEMLASGSWKIQISSRDNMAFTDGITPDVGTSVYDLTNAYTPYIRSQLVAGFNTSASLAYDLFKVHTICDGTSANALYKVEINNVRSAGSVPGSKYGSFSLILRAFADTDAKPQILERYDNLNLDVNSSNYVARRIGDVYN